RLDPQKRKDDGPAAKPGYSTHQSGISLDIKTGMTRAMELATPMVTSPIFNWLTINAASYGFKADVWGEPWHWTHKVPNMVGDPAILAAVTPMQLFLAGSPSVP